MVLCLAVGWAAFTAVASAEAPSLQTSFSDRAILQAGQVVQGDYFAAGPRVEISGIVNGDLYVAGGQVLVDGVVNGDVIVAGGKVTMSGTVAQDARIAGGQVMISGTIGRSATVAGGDVQVTTTARIGENLFSGGGNVQVGGHIGKDARIGAARVTLSSQIERDLAVAAGSVHLTSKAMVGGKLRYWSEEAPVIDEEATVRGPIIRRPLPEGWSLENARRGIFGIRVMAAVVGFLSTLILGLVLLRIYPVFARRVTATMRQRPAASLGWGAAALLIIPLVAVSFLITLFALPIGVILLALYLPMVYLARIYAITCLGQFLFRRQADSASLAGPFVAGLVLYTILTLIPLVGGLMTVLAILFGLGAMLITKKEIVNVLREHQEI
jgi:hypothetical protein